MRSGISTACLYPMLLEKSLSTLLSMDFRLFEIFINTCSELKKDYLLELNRMMKDRGATAKSVHPFTSGYEGFLLFSDYERRFWDGLDFYKHYFEACNLLGAEILVLHGKRADGRSSIPEKLYFDRYLRLFELGKTFGVTVAQENVSRFLSNSPDFVLRMKQYCGENCAFVFDIKQAVRGGVNPYRLCSAMGERIVHIHLNDNNTDSDCLLPGFGSMDYPRFLALLKKFGFGGDLILEVYRNSFQSLDELKTAQKPSMDL